MDSSIYHHNDIVLALKVCQKIFRLNSDFYNEILTFLVNSVSSLDIKLLKKKKKLRFWINLGFEGIIQGSQGNSDFLEIRPPRQNFRTDNKMFDF